MEKRDPKTTEPAAGERLIARTISFSAMGLGIIISIAALSIALAIRSLGHG